MIVQLSARETGMVMNPLRWTRRQQAEWAFITLLGAAIGFVAALYHIFKFDFGKWIMAVRILFGLFGPDSSWMFIWGFVPDAAAGAVLAAIAFYIWMLVPPENAS